MTNRFRLSLSRPVLLDHAVKSGAVSVARAARARRLPTGPHALYVRAERAPPPGGLLDAQGAPPRAAHPVVPQTRENPRPQRETSLIALLLQPSLTVLSAAPPSPECRHALDPTGQVAVAHRHPHTMRSVRNTSNNLHERSTRSEPACLTRWPAREQITPVRMTEVQHGEALPISIHSAGRSRCD